MQSKAAENCRRVKKILTKAFSQNGHGEKISVRGERGTAYGWVNAHIDIVKPITCQCDEMFGEGMSRQPGYCPACKSALSETSERAESAIRAAKKLQAVQFGTYTSDDGYGTENDEFLLQVSFL